MEPKSYWALFCVTGNPVAYVLYRSAQEERQQTEAIR